MANKIREIRETRGLTQDELGRRTGSTGATISRLESGARKLTQPYMEAISKALGCSPGDLVGRAIPNVPETSLVPITGVAAKDVWRVPAQGEGVTTETLPVLLPHRINHLSGGAWRIEDDHASDLAPAGSYAISVPVEGLRKTPLDGDWLVIRSKEGRMERTMLAQAKVDARGVCVDLGEGDIEVTGGNWPVGIVVAVYKET